MHLSRHGFALIPGVLSSAQVGNLRAQIRPLFDSPETIEIPGGGKVLVDIFNRHTELAWLLTHPPLVKVLQSLLGDDFVYLRENGAHLNVYAGAHKDTTSQEKAGHLFHKDNDYLMVQAAIYLQENGSRCGGGLEVEPRSHKRDDLFITGERESWLIRKLYPFTPVPSRAGDLVIFDFRINHRARVAIEPSEDKLAIFIACSRNNRHVSAYHTYLRTRPEEVYRYLKS